jgi:hypothetical protein
MSSFFFLNNEGLVVFREIIALHYDIPNAQRHDAFVQDLVLLTLSLLMSYIYVALSKARNLTSYMYGRDFTGDFAS